jgi:hypothetical protein
MSVGNVKQGDRVVYVVGDVEYNAVALGGASFGVHPGLAAANFHLNLVYLDGQGVAVKVIGAPLLTAAASDEEFEQIVMAEARMKPELVAADFDTSAKDAAAANHAAHAERILRNPREIGWRPVADGKEVAELKAQVASLEASLKAATDAAQAASVPVLGTVPGPEWYIQTKQYSDGTIVTGTPPLPELSPAQQDALDGKPSAEDLDAHVAEQDAAAATE